VQGLCCLIGETSDAGLDIVCVVEGFATRASVHEATGHTVAVAFQAGIAREARTRADGGRRTPAGRGDQSSVRGGGGGSRYLADAEADSDESRVLRPLQAAAWTYRIAFGPRAGQKVLTVQGAMARDAARAQDLCADHQGFSLHALVRCDAHER